MDFLLWAVRSLHVVGVVTWIGGLIYQEVISFSVAQALESEQQMVHMLRRFVPFVWMCVWSVLVTGIAMMLFSPRFVFFEFSDHWSTLLGLKQMVFLLMVFFSIGYARMTSHLYGLISQGGVVDEKGVVHYRQARLFGRINIILGIAALLLAAGMR